MAAAAQHASDWDRDAALTTARILLEIKAVNFRPDEPYTFTSGWKSPVYIDCRKIIYFPRARNRICDLGVEKIGRHVGYETIDVVAGGETAGIPFAAWIADRMLTPMAYVRKQPKGFGRGSQIEGEVPEGRNTLLVEDLTTDGASKIRFAQALRDAGAVCDHTFVVFFYGVFPGSFETMKRMNLSLAPPLHLVGRAGGVPRAALLRRGGAEGGAEIPGGSGGLVQGAWRGRQRGGGSGGTRERRVTMWRCRAALFGASALACAAAAPAPASAQQLATRDTLTIGITQFPSTFHPNIDNMAAKSYVLGFARRPLTAYDPDWALTCLLCDRVPSLENGGAARETTPEGKPGIRVTYRLREDARWGDGRPVSAEDLRFAWEAGREAATGFGPAEFYRSAYELVVEDSRTVTLRFDKVTFEYASAGDFQPLPAHIERARWEADPRGYRNRTAYDTETAMPGLWSGPYRITAVQPGAGVTLERNDAWAGAGAGLPPHPGPHGGEHGGAGGAVAGRAARHDRGRARPAGGAGRRAGAPRRPGASRVAYKPGLVYEHLDLQHDHPALGDRRVRQALLMATDRAQIVARLFENRQTVAHSSVNPLDRMHDADTRQWPHDPARGGGAAGRGGLAARAGRHPPQRRRREALLRADDHRRQPRAGGGAAGAARHVARGRRRGAHPERAAARAVRRDAVAAALAAASRSTPGSAARRTCRAAPCTRTRSRAPSATGPARTTATWRNAEMDALLEALPQELDAEKRRGMWSRLQAIYAEELPALPLWFRADAHVWPRWLEGVRPTGHLNPTSLWVEEWRLR